MENKQAILLLLRANKQAFLNFGIKDVGLFGSYSRDEQTENSDIDLLVDFEPSKETYDNLMAANHFIQVLFKGKKTEVVTKNGLSPYIGPKILSEVVYA